MLNSRDLNNFLKKEKIDFFSGVPDSVLKNFTSLIPLKKNFITANEGSSVALAAGYYLKTKKLPVVYMQNSGLGNAINPLISLVNRKVYSIPMLLIIGWRGMPGKKDEPQHQDMGKITKKLLNLMNIKFAVLRQKKDFIKLKKIIYYSKNKNTPVACLIPPKTLLNSQIRIDKNKREIGLKRYEILFKILDKLKNKRNYNIISTTGYTSRELNEIRSKYKNLKCKFFYVVGSMGHASSVALGASFKKKSNVICLDGDGSLLMHMGSLNDVANFSGKNYKHVLFNNNSHESVGGQTTKSEKINFESVVKGVGYKKFYKISNKKKFNNIWDKFIKSIGPSFLEIKISKGTLKTLGRPKNLMLIKKNFMRKNG